MIPGFHRVTKSDCCGVCGKPDWCLNGDDGECCICSRVESENKWGDAGWFHWIDGKIIEPQKRYVQQTIEHKIDCQAILQRYRLDTLTPRLESFASTIGVTAASLRRLNCCWAANHNAWAFPMRNEIHFAIGIRLRTEDGGKFAVKGSRAGLFIPESIDFAQTLWICEGPTDCAAMLDIGLNVIGRPSCQGQEKLVAAIVRKQKPREVVIVADADAPGQRGAEILADSIWASCKIIAPAKFKDARAWINAGGNRRAFEMAAKNTRYHRRNKAG